MYRKCRKESLAKLMFAKMANAVQNACTTTWAKILPEKLVSRRRYGPDFSDIAHLTVAFEGICLPREQMKLVKDTLDFWSRRTHSTPGEMAHLYIKKKYPFMREKFAKYRELTNVYQNAITKIIDMAVESDDSLDNSLGPLLVSYAEDSGVFKERVCFDYHYWQRICEALCELPQQFPRSKHRREITLTWRIIILFLYYKIEYAVELQHRRTHEYHSFDNPSYEW